MVHFTLKMDAQDNIPKVNRYDGTSIGLGYGPDFGNLGIAILHYGRNKHVGVFGGVGSTPAGIAFDGGIKLRLLSSKYKAKVNPFLLGMYSYTTFVYMKDDPQFDKIFYGPSVGIGYDLKFRPSSRGFWSFAIILPLDNSKVTEYMQYLTKNYNIEILSQPSTFRYSIGYRYLIN